MGKIRAKTIGDQEAEQKEREDAEKRRLAKIEAEKAAGKARKSSGVDSMDDGKAEKIAEEKSEAKGSSEKPAEKIQNQEASKEEAKEPEQKKLSEEKSHGGGKKFKKIKERSGKYKEAKALIDTSKLYPLSQALDLVEKTHLAKFDESLELHINTLSTGISGQVTLPHGTGKQTRVAVLAPASNAAAADALLKQIEAGKIDFDILVATPDAMPKLAKVAKVLGPRGLMPNPKNGTITPNPETVAEKYAGGQMNFKTEAKAPVIHMMVGKLSFGKEKLSENIKTALSAVKSANIRNVTLKSTMSPAVKLQVGK